MLMGIHNHAVGTECATGVFNIARHFAAVAYDQVARTHELRTDDLRCLQRDPGAGDTGDFRGGNMDRG
ncbi:hypothetical protein XBKQ1_2360030 [Xenorhabdus bovienii str. kraussei Quebec]|uniref:Uncharacterized protein n=1 Tax=Xenorhabdus bovienii str. kraussei Quebec TaxID=1398203 RepID=A0A077PGY1_XENBV|nr:hypothetical protein XBKQ1_2360030 [Xenorhabdus bovienii str. kraussei Quebec]